MLPMMLLPTSGAQTGRRSSVPPPHPDRPAQLVRGDPHGPTDPGGGSPSSPSEPHGPHDPGASISDLQWILAWAALGLVLWLLAKTAVGYRLIYYGVVLLLLLVLLTQYQWLSAVFAPFKALTPGLVTGQGGGTGGGSGSGGAKSNIAARHIQSSKNGPRSPPRSGAAAVGAAGHTAEQASTLAALG